MNTMAPTGPAVLHRHRVPLTVGPAAAAQARGRVRAAICTWDVPVDPSVAALLTSELVTNAIRHEAGETVLLAITCCCDQLRVDVHDTSSLLPVPADAPADAETGRGLMLVASLSAEWGYYATPAGKAVYFTLAFQPDLYSGDERGPQVFAGGHVEAEPPAIQRTR
jgi:anti-sigma regulatory factor (Ser/Thr protein kinase)